MRVVAEPENLAELISDCAELPDAVLAVPSEPSAAQPDRPVPAPWQVDDACLAQVAGLDDYGS